jgi:hypothetical protein
MRDEEANTRIEFMPLAVDHHAARAIATDRSIAEGGVIAPDLMR